MARVVGAGGVGGPVRSGDGWVQRTATRLPCVLLLAGWFPCVLLLAGWYSLLCRMYSARGKFVGKVLLTAIQRLILRP